MPVMFTDTFLMIAALCIGTLILIASAGPQIRDALRNGRAVTGFGTFDRRKKPLKYWLTVGVPLVVIVLMVALIFVSATRYKSPF